MMKITTFNRLKKYENYLYTAKYANYMRGLTNKQVEDLIVAGEELDIHYKNNHCAACALKFAKQLAELYFEQKVKNENNKKKKEEENGSNE